MIAWWWRLVRFGFRLLYNEMAFAYDWVSASVSLGAWRQWQRAGIKHLNVPPESALILELAHGTGDTQIDLHHAGYRSIGYDLSPYMGRIASRKLRRKHITPVLVRGRAESLPFPDQQFDAILSCFPTNFIIHKDTLRETRRVLKPGGRLVVIINGVLTSGGIISRGLEWLYRITGQRNTSTSKKEVDPRTYAPLIILFDEAGYQTEIVYEWCDRSVAVVVIAHKPVM